MASEALPETQSQWRRRGLFAVGGIALLASAFALIAGANSSRETGPKLTHTVTRGQLLVTVTEQGILESSENTEIKCKVRGFNTIIWVIESGTVVEPGDELVRLETLYIEEQIDERSKYAHWSRSGAEHSKAELATSELAVSEYEQGRYIAELMALEKDMAVAESNLVNAKNILRHTKMMQESRYLGVIEVEEKEFAVKQAELTLELKKTQLRVLKQFTKAEELQRLKGDLAANKATHAANIERAVADASRRDRALEEFEHCVIRAKKGGLVIHRSAAEWEVAPIAEGATVHKDQVLLLMPDLSQMRVKVGIHESNIDRLEVGLPAKVTLPDKTLDGSVAEVATVTLPSGWWTGNEVRYDTFIQLPELPGLNPGMSAEVEILVARHEDVLSIPVAAIVEAEQGDFCWVKTAQGTERRKLQLGDSNDVFTIVDAGLKEGDEVILNALALGESKTTKAKKKTTDKAKPPK